MRFDVAASNSARVQPTRIFHSPPETLSNGDIVLRVCHVKIQVFDPVTLYLTRKIEHLQRVDAIGNPVRGFQLGQGITEFYYVVGELWATCNQVTSVECEYWPMPWRSPVGISL